MIVATTERSDGGSDGLRLKAAKGAAWTAASTWLLRGLSTVTFIVVGHQLSPFEFGLVALANVFILSLGMLTSSDFGTYVARDRGEELMPGGVAGTDALGIWSVGARLVKLVRDTGTQVVNSVSTAVLTRLQGQPERMHRAYRDSMASAGALLFPMLGYLAVTGQDLVPFVMGEQWAPAAPVPSMPALTAVVSVLSYFDRALFAIADRLGVEIVMVLGIASVHLSCVLIFVQYGLLALATALFSWSHVVTLVRKILLKRILGVPLSSLFRALRVLLASAVPSVVVFGLGNVIRNDLDLGVSMSLAITTMALLLMYVATLRLLAAPTYHDLARTARSLMRRARSEPAGGAQAASEAESAGTPDRDHR